MFSGKTEELLRLLRRAEVAKQSIIVFKPAIDNRSGPSHITSHAGGSYRAKDIAWSKLMQIDVGYWHDVVVIDEAQFFDSDLPSIVKWLLLNDKDVIVAGLDKDYRGEPFGTMPELLAIADYVKKLTAICQVCKDPATMTYRTSNEVNTILVGGADEYEARCRTCHKI